MEITNIRIQNYKSIEDIDFDIKKYGNSYTTMLVGINESGKSNILEAMSYFQTPEDKVNYDTIHFQKDTDNDPVILSFTLVLDDKQACALEIRKEIENGKLLKFGIENIRKIVYLEHGETSFSEDYSFEVVNLVKGLFIKKEQRKTTDSKGASEVGEITVLSKKNDDEESFEPLTLELFQEYFFEDIEAIIRQNEPEVLLWIPTEEYLVSKVDLNEFKDDVDSNIPLKHMFFIAGMNSPEKIKLEIEKIGNQSLRRRLEEKLGAKATSYIKKIWRHKIKIDTDISDTGLCTVSVKDTGRENKYNFHEMVARSEGFKQFISLILSLSVETKLSNRKNNLILIDEPEAHLHPSGIRDLRKELLAIGEKNYLFVSTHSPFLVDRKHKGRNIIVRKNRRASTKKVEIDENTEIIDDEVLIEAFGIEVYKDLLNPHSILVEGASDKKILKKASVAKGCKKYGVTNGHGSNIDTLAAKLNDTDISPLVLLDDDRGGKIYKEKILKIGGSYSEKNVFTIRDLVGGIVSGGTIEDALGTFFDSKAKQQYEEHFKGEEFELSFNDKEPKLKQLKKYMLDGGKNEKITDDFLDRLKICVSDNFKVTPSSIAKNFSILGSLIDEIESRLG